MSKIRGSDTSKSVSMETIPDNLAEFFEKNPRPALAFSGGVDSTYLMYVCRELDVDMIPVFYTGGFQTVAQLVNAENLCQRYKFTPSFVEDNILTVPEVVANGENRCYQCKKRMITAMWNQVKGFDRAYMMDGTNASDDPSNRPGMRFLEEFGVRSPLKECGLTKPDIRRLSKAASIPIWDMPSDSCLATRIPTGTALTVDDLVRTERAEKGVRMLGLKDIRVRTSGNAAILETLPSQKDVLEENKDEVEDILLRYYDSITYAERKPGL